MSLCVVIVNAPEYPQKLQNTIGYLTTEIMFIKCMNKYVLGVLEGLVR